MLSLCEHRVPRFWPPWILVNPAVGFSGANRSSGRESCGLHKRGSRPHNMLQHRGLEGRIEAIIEVTTLMQHDATVTRPLNWAGSVRCQSCFLNIQSGAPSQKPCGGSRSGRDESFLSRCEVYQPKRAKTLNHFVVFLVVTFRGWQPVGLCAQPRFMLLFGISAKSLLTNRQNVRVNIVNQATVHSGKRTWHFWQFFQPEYHLQSIRKRWFLIAMFDCWRAQTTFLYATKHPTASDYRWDFKPTSDVLLSIIWRNHTAETKLWRNAWKL